MTNIKEVLKIGKNWKEEINAFIEIPKKSTVKYEIDEETGILTADRFLHSAVYYPANYGFIPQTLADDGDPLDILVLGETVVPCCVLPSRVIGLYYMEDEKGIDEKIIAVPTGDRYYDNVNNIEDLSEHELLVIEEFFKTYKNLEKNKWVKIQRLGNKEEAQSVIEKYIK